LRRKIGPAGAVGEIAPQTKKIAKLAALARLFSHFLADETLISSWFFLCSDTGSFCLVLAYLSFPEPRPTLHYAPTDFSSLTMCLCFTGVVYGSLISTQNNETGSKVFNDNEQFNHMLGHKKRHEANRQHPTNQGKFRLVSKLTVW